MTRVTPRGGQYDFSCGRDECILDLNIGYSNGSGDYEAASVFSVGVSTVNDAW